MQNIKYYFLSALLFLFLFLFLSAPFALAAVGADCDPWSCSCPVGERCWRVSSGTYRCQPTGKEGSDCQPAITYTLCPEQECAEGLKCKHLPALGDYRCIPVDADPNNYSCNPWTEEPCKSRGERCVREGFNIYSCSTEASVRSLCKNMPVKCDECVKGGGLWTAVGCIPVSNLNDFIGWLLSKLIFVASGIAFLLMVFGAIQILTSAGNPDKVKAGKELITSALSGLLLVILSIFLLKLIGVDILHIPGL